MPILKGDSYHGGLHEPRIDEGAARRLRNLARFALLWAVLVIVRLVHLQIFSHDDFVRQAQRQQQQTIDLAAPRGAILDREEQPLAMSVPVKSVLVNPRLLPNAPVAVELLSRVLSLDAAKLQAGIDAALNGNRGFLWVKRRISLEEAERVSSLRLAGVEFRDETTRNYPKGTVAAHVVGSVDHEEKGSGGLELGLQDDLEGIPGSLRLMTDVTHRGYDSFTELPAQPGKNVTTTIDERIQFAAETHLREAVIDGRCKSGSVVAMDPRTGDILAMASYPTFNPNEPVKPGQDLSSRLNIAVASPFEPGSVFKVITLSAGLETTRLTPESPINCYNGRYSLFGRTIREAHNGYGVMPMRMVLAKSSNIGAIQVGLAIGIKNFHEYITRFGFGRKTGIPLPAESAGQVHGPRDWQKTSMGSVAMGHEITTTTLQLAQAASVVANNGMLIKPRIVLKRQRPGEAPEYEPVAAPVKVLRPETAIKMRSMMEDVLLPGGTGAKARVSGYSIGGKTGSAQIFDFNSRQYTHKYNASFMGMAPLNNPQLVLVVTLNGSSEYGGIAAAPVFAKIAAAALHVMDVPKDVLEPVQIAKAATKEADVVEGTTSLADEEEPETPETLLASAGLVVEMGGPRVPNYLGRNLRDVLNESAATGIAVEVRGSGIAKQQRPAPGKLLRQGERIIVQFDRR